MCVFEVLNAFKEARPIGSYPARIVLFKSYTRVCVMRMGEREADRWVYICAYISYHVPGEAKYNDRENFFKYLVFYRILHLYLY